MRLLLRKKNINIVNNIIENKEIDETNINFIQKTYFYFVDKIVYINLEERKDRKEQIEHQLRFINKDKIIRFNAIKQKRGAVGCYKSHIAVLEMAIENNWENCLILEDDMIWRNFDANYPILEKLTKNNFDVIILGGIDINYDKDTLRCYHAVTTTAYLINKSYYFKLLENFKKGCELKIEYNVQQYNMDEYWNNLIKEDNWYVVVPNLCIQKSDFSNIDNQYVDKLGRFS